MRGFNNAGMHAPTPPLDHQPSHHVVISGAGRAGTSFLMVLLTRLDLDTGFTAEDIARDLARPAHAGLERDLRDHALPRVVKNPNLCDHIDEVLARTDLKIEHLIVPLREPEAAAQSRQRVQQAGLQALSWRKRLSARFKRKALDGGLWPGTQHLPQEPVLLDRVHRLLLAVAAEPIPVTLLAYPRLVRDPAYLHAKLAPIFPGLAWPVFQAAFAAVVRPDWVHAYGQEPLATASAPALLAPPEWCYAR
jgi:hypothetical protein